MRSIARPASALEAEQATSSCCVRGNTTRAIRVANTSTLGSEGIVEFLHARYGSDHHLIAFAHGATKGWHHSAWDVADVEQVGRDKMQMERAGYVDGWGVGRHVLGSNYFQYVRDPWGSFWEYSVDIDYVGVGVEWPGGNHPPEDSLYLWGPAVPAYFFENAEGEAGGSVSE